MTDSIAAERPRNRAPKGDTYYRKVARNYEKRRRKQPWWGVEQDQMKALLDALPDGLTVVDVPFGTGRFVPYYLDKGFTVFGLDASADMLAAARETLGEMLDACTLTTGDSAALPYEDGAFDLLVSTRFLRDIIDFAHARRTLAEFARVTTGWAIIQLGQSRVPGRIPEDDETMGGAMDEGQIDALLGEYGFAPLERRLVKEMPQDNSDIFHILCRRVG